MLPSPERNPSNLFFAALCGGGSGTQAPAGRGHTSGAGCRASALAFLILSSGLPGYAWGGKTTLARKYRPGQQMVYQTNIQTRAAVHSNPEGLKAFLPPLPTQLSIRQQNTVTVRAVKADGVAEVESRFDRFEFQSNLSDLAPEENGDSALSTQEEFGERVSGQVLTVHYDRQGRLLDFQGADGMLQELDAPFRETARQILRMFLEQMGGNALYPDHPVKEGEEWIQRLNTLPTEAYPFSVEGENTLRFAGKTRYGGVKAAIIDINFTNLLRPSMDRLRQVGPLAQLASQGMGLEIRIEGKGQGRALVALDDGRLLQNHTTLYQVLKARLERTAGIVLPAGGPLTFDVDSETKLEVEAAGARGR